MADKVVAAAVVLEMAMVAARPDRRLAVTVVMVALRVAGAGVAKVERATLRPMDKAEERRDERKVRRVRVVLAATVTAVTKVEEAVAVGGAKVAVAMAMVMQTPSMMAAAVAEVVVAAAKVAVVAVQATVAAAANLVMRKTLMTRPGREPISATLQCRWGWTLPVLLMHKMDVDSPGVVPMRMQTNASGVWLPLATMTFPKAWSSLQMVPCNASGTSTLASASSHL